MQDAKAHTSFKIFVDFVSEDKIAVNWTSSYSCTRFRFYLQTGVKHHPTVSNSSRNEAFSVAGREATSADSERRVAWSIGACPNILLSMRNTRANSMSNYLL